MATLHADGDGMRWPAFPAGHPAAGDVMGWPAGKVGYPAVGDGYTYMYRYMYKPLYMQPFQFKAICSAKPLHFLAKAVNV